MRFFSLLEPLTEKLLAAVGPRTPADPIRERIAASRVADRAAIERRDASAACELAPGVLAHDEDATAAYDALVARAVHELRRGHGGALDWADAWLYRDEPELMDDPTLDVARRERALELLDRFNDKTGSYASFAAVVARQLAAGRTLRGARERLVVHDLATGHGGFPRWLARHHGDLARVEASDRERAYFERATARAGSDDRVAFSVLDALDLEPLRDRGVDVITCTNSLHHFKPGQVARMLGEAARAARVGVVFIDPERRHSTWLMLDVVGRTFGGSYEFWHDSVVTARRCFDREELALIAALAPGMPADVRVAIELVKPGHVAITATRGRV